MTTNLPATLAWRSAAALPIGLGLPTLFTHDGAIYLTGGDSWVPGGDAPDGQQKVYFDKVLRYDAASDCWDTVCDLPVPGIHFGAAIWKGRLFLLGGADGHAMQQTMWVKDWPDGDWQVIGRWEHPTWGDCIMQDGQYLYFFGGWAAPQFGDVQCGDLRRYDMNTPEVPPVRLDTLPGVPRSYHAGTLCNGGIYLFGGQHHVGADVTFLAEAWRYDLQDQAWTRLRDLPARTKAYTATTLDDRTILLPGGWHGSAPGDDTPNPGVTAQVWAYDTLTDTYTRMNDLPAAICAMSFARLGSLIIGAGGEIRSRHRVDWTWRCDVM